MDDVTRLGPDVKLTINYVYGSFGDVKDWKRVVWTNTFRPLLVTPSYSTRFVLLTRCPYTYLNNRVPVAWVFTQYLSERSLRTEHSTRGKCYRYHDMCTVKFTGRGVDPYGGPLPQNPQETRVHSHSNQPFQSWSGVLRSESSFIG